MAAETPLPDAADDEAVVAKVTPFGDAHSTKLRRAGRFAGLGYPAEWIADRFGASAAAVRDWQRHPAFLDGYATAEGQATRDATMALSKIALSFPQLVDTSIAVALDTSHKDSSVERRYLIDKVLTPMTIQHSTTTHEVGERFWGPVAAALSRVTARMNSAPVAVPLLIEGSAAAAEYGETPPATGLSRSESAAPAAAVPTESAKAS